MFKLDFPTAVYFYFWKPTYDCRWNRLRQLLARLKHLLVATSWVLKSVITHERHQANESTLTIQVTAGKVTGSS